MEAILIKLLFVNSSVTMPVLYSVLCYFWYQLQVAPRADIELKIK